jgi:hypothetical protein
LRYAVSTPSGLDRGWVVEDMTYSGSSDAWERQGYTGVNEFPDTIWDFLARDYVARDFIGLFEHYGMTVEGDAFRGCNRWDRSHGFSTGNGGGCFSCVLEGKIDDLFEVCGG